MTDVASWAHRHRNAHEIEITPSSAADHEDHVTEPRIMLDTKSEIFRWIAEGDGDDSPIRSVARMASHGIRGERVGR